MGHRWWGWERAGWLAGWLAGRPAGSSPPLPCCCRAGLPGLLAGVGPQAHLSSVDPRRTFTLLTRGVPTAVIATAHVRKRLSDSGYSTFKGEFQRPERRESDSCDPSASGDTLLPGRLPSGPGTGDKHRRAAQGSTYKSQNCHMCCLMSLTLESGNNFSTIGALL